MNGVAKDSRRVKIGGGVPVAESDRAAFDRERDRLMLLLRDSTGTVARSDAIARQGAETSQRWLP
jgi:hypothetical protein